MKHLAFWTEQSSPNESISLIKELALAHALAGGPQGVVIANLVSSDSFLELCDFELDYSTISGSDATHCRQALAFFKKCRYLPLQGDPRAKAIEKFEYAERKCTESNELFRLRDHGSLNLELWADAAIMAARSKISRVLGELPKLGELDFKFGPGATTLTKKSMASSVEKLDAGFSCSEDLLPYAARLLEEMPMYTDLHQTSERVVTTPAERPRMKPEEMHAFYVKYEVYAKLCDEFDFVPMSFETYLARECVEECTYATVPVLVTPGRVNFVPKDAKTYRSVVVEGSLNVMAQGAIGRYMTNRLMRFGINLKDQSRNQELARLGSIDGSLATIDLVSASDMMSIGIIKELLPWEWYFFLSTMRSSIVMIDGAPLVQAKFSSMGNGYTFPLQSLIFWALASSVCDSGETVSVYGDDIIVPSHRAVQVMRLLEIAGFEPNMKKSYWQGPFRESCGADYLRGLNIRPCYHREVMSPAELFRLHNFYVRHQMADFAELIVQRINPSLVIYGPDGFGDGHLIGVTQGRQHKRAASHGYGGVLFDTFKFGPRRDERRHRPGFRVLPAYTVYTRDGQDSVLPDFDLSVIDGLSPIALANRLRAQVRYQSQYAPESLPEGDDPVSGGVYKLCSLPGVNGYRKVSIYTFDRS